MAEAEKAETGNPRLILASASPRRRDLLAQAGVTPDDIIATEIDESPMPRELPRGLALRLAMAKADAVRRMPAARGAFVLAGDTVVACGRRILPKPDEAEEARACLTFLSGRQHTVFTGIALVTPEGMIRTRIVSTKVRFKRLSQAEIDAYLASEEWRGKAGGYAIQGMAGAFVPAVNGSVSNVIGLPLYETLTLLEGNGYPVWREARP
jgi:septum formation protein